MLTGPGTAAPVVLVKQFEQHPQGHIRDVDESWLCGPSLPTGPIALPAPGRSRSGLKRKGGPNDSDGIRVHDLPTSSQKALSTTSQIITLDTKVKEIKMSMFGI